MAGRARGPSAAADVAAHEQRLARLAQELLDSEVRYAAALASCARAELLAARAEGGGGAAAGGVRCLFATLRQVAALSCATVRALQRAAREYGSDRVGAVLVRLADAMYVYEEYAGIHASLREEIAALGADPAFARSWRAAVHAVAAGARTFPAGPSVAEEVGDPAAAEVKLPSSLNSLLILPIQRVPRYELLLEEMRREAGALEDLESAASHLGAGRNSYSWWAQEQALVLEARDCFRAVAARMEIAVQTAQDRPFLLAAALPPPPSRIAREAKRGPGRARHRRQQLHQRQQEQQQEHQAHHQVEHRRHQQRPLRATPSEDLEEGCPENGDLGIDPAATADVLRSLLETEYEHLRQLVLAEEIWALAQIKRAAVEADAGPEPQRLLLLAQGVLQARQLSGHFVRVLQRCTTSPTQFWDDLCWLASLASLYINYALAFLHAWRLVAPDFQSATDAVPSWARSHASLARKLLGVGVSKAADKRPGLSTADFARLREPMHHIVALEADFARVLLHPGPFRARRPDFAEAWSSARSLVPSVQRVVDDHYLARLLQVLAPLVDPFQDELERVGMLYVKKRPHLICLCADRLVAGPLPTSSKFGLASLAPGETAATICGGHEGSGALPSSSISSSSPPPEGSVSSSPAPPPSPRGAAGGKRRGGKGGAVRFVQIYLRNVDRIVAESVSATVKLEPNILAMSAPDLLGTVGQDDDLALWTVPAPRAGQTRTAVFDAWVHSLAGSQRRAKN